MLTITHCKKILGDKAADLSDEDIDALRHEMYVLANLSFSNWKKNCSSTKAEELSSLFVGVQPTSNPLPVGEPMDVKR